MRAFLNANLHFSSAKMCRSSSSAPINAVSHSDFSWEINEDFDYSFLTTNYRRHQFIVQTTCCFQVASKSVEHRTNLTQTLQASVLLSFAAVNAHHWTGLVTLVTRQTSHLLSRMYLNPARGPHAVLACLQTSWVRRWAAGYRESHVKQCIQMVNLKSTLFCSFHSLLFPANRIKTSAWLLCYTQFSNCIVVWKVIDVRVGD